MMMMFPATALFFMMLIFSTIMIVSSSSWVMMWIGMELNTLMFIALVVSGKTTQCLEGGVKYFLAQASGSILFLVGVVGMSMGLGSLSVYSFYVGVFLKAGIAPCHTWFPQVMGVFSWMGCLLLSTWQKVGPMFIVFYSTSLDSFGVLLVASFLSAWVGAFGAFKQTQLRTLMAYSSVSHMGWMIGASLSSVSASVVYFFSYIINAGLIFVLMTYLSSESVGVFKKSLWKFSTYRVALMVLLLSLSGMPPLFGFYPKVMVLQSLVSGGFMIASVALIFSSVVTLYMYLSIFVGSLFNFGPVHGFVSHESKSGSWLFISSVVFSAGLGLVMVVSVVCYALNYIY